MCSLHNDGFADADLAIFKGYDSFYARKLLSDVIFIESLLAKKTHQ
jgi:hypothetical protein